MRFFFCTMVLPLMATLLGCASGIPLPRISVPMGCCSVDCCTTNCRTEWDSCCESSGCLRGCDGCASGSCGSQTFDVPTVPDVSVNYNAHSDTTAAVPSGIPTIAAPVNVTPAPEVGESVSGDLRPSTTPQSAVQPPTPAAPAPEPQRIKTTKPVKNFLPSILSDEA